MHEIKELLNQLFLDIQKIEDKEDFCLFGIEINKNQSAIDFKSRE